MVSVIDEACEMFKSSIIGSGIMIRSDIVTVIDEGEGEGERGIFV